MNHLKDKFGAVRRNPYHERAHWIHSFMMLHVVHYTYKYWFINHKNVIRKYALGIHMQYNDYQHDAWQWALKRYIIIVLVDNELRTWTHKHNWLKHLKPIKVKYTYTQVYNKRWLMRPSSIYVSTLSNQITYVYSNSTRNDKNWPMSK